MNDEPLLIAEGLTKHYGRQLGCRDAFFELYEGEVMAVVGESGSGQDHAAADAFDPDRAQRRPGSVPHA